MTMPRRSLLTMTLAVLASGAAMPAAAHHGLMLWDEENVVTVEGFIAEEMDGYPHWEVEIRVSDGDDWIVDLGNDFDMERAGLNKDGSDFTIGRKIRVEGHVPRDSDTRLIRPLRITIDGKVHTFPAARE